MVHPRRQVRCAVPKAGINGTAMPAAARWVAAAVAGLAICGVAAEPVGAAEAPPSALACSGCHPANTAVQTPVPLLAGLPAAHIVSGMQAFRTGTRPGTVMDRIAKGFSDAEIAAIAAWYVGQKQ